MTDAQIAMSIGDQHGNAAMATYLRLARNSDYAEPLPANVELRDRSFVRFFERADGFTIIAFGSPDREGKYHVEHRQTGPIPVTVHTPDENSMPMMPWPNTESVQAVLMEMAMQEAGWTDYIQVTDRDLAVMQTFITHARHAVNAELRNDPTPASVMNEMAVLEREYAREARRRIPDYQWQALVAYLTDQYDEPDC